MKTVPENQKPDFSNPGEAARAWMDAQARITRLEFANAELRTEVDVLELVLKDSQTWMTISEIPWLLDYFSDTDDATMVAIWRFLTHLSKSMGYNVYIDEDAMGDTMIESCYNKYNIIVIDRMKRALDEMPKLLLDLRK